MPWYTSNERTSTPIYNDGNPLKPEKLEKSWSAQGQCIGIFLEYGREWGHYHNLFVLARVQSWGQIELRMLEDVRFDSNKMFFACIYRNITLRNTFSSGNYGYESFRQGYQSLFLKWHKNSRVKHVIVYDYCAHMFPWNHSISNGRHTAKDCQYKRWNRSILPPYSRITTYTSCGWALKNVQELKTLRLHITNSFSLEQQTKLRVPRARVDLVQVWSIPAVGWVVVYCLECWQWVRSGRKSREMVAS